MAGARRRKVRALEYDNRIDACAGLMRNAITKAGHLRRENLIQLGRNCRFPNSVIGAALRRLEADDRVAVHEFSFMSGRLEIALYEVQP